jgi:hypothetical protein
MEAVNFEMVSFKDPALQRGYEDRIFEVLRPQMLAGAQAELEKRGILAGFPERSKFDSDRLFAEALERHCGMIPGSFFIQSESGLIGQWQAGDVNQTDDDKFSCLSAAMMYLAASGESFNLGFIGNEAITPGN